VFLRAETHCKEKNGAPDLFSFPLESYHDAQSGSAFGQEQIQLADELLELQVELQVFRHNVWQNRKGLLFYFNKNRKDLLFDPWQAPERHLSFTVDGSKSLHGVPSASLSYSHFPTLLHVTVLQALVAQAMPSHGSEKKVALARVSLVFAFYRRSSCYFYLMPSSRHSFRLSIFI